MKNFHVTVFLLLCCALLQGQMITEKYFGHAENTDDEPERMARTADGGFVICGHTAASGLGRFDAFLLKTDSEGQVEWQQTYGSPQQDGARFVAPTPIDSGYVFCGFSEADLPGHAKAFVKKTDAQGNVLWSQQLEYGKYALAECVSLDREGGYLVAWTAYVAAEFTTAFLTVLDANGQIRFTHAVASQENSSTAIEAFQTTDGNYLLHYIKNNDTQVIKKIDAAGQVFWEEESHIYYFHDLFRPLNNWGILDTADVFYYIEPDFFNGAPKVSIKGINTEGGQVLNQTLPIAATYSSLFYTQEKELGIDFFSGQYNPNTGAAFWQRWLLNTDSLVLYDTFELEGPPMVQLLGDKKGELIGLSHYYDANQADIRLWKFDFEQTVWEQDLTLGTTKYKNETGLICSIRTAQGNYLLLSTYFSWLGSTYFNTLSALKTDANGNVLIENPDAFNPDIVFPSIFVDAIASPDDGAFVLYNNASDNTLHVLKIGADTKTLWSHQLSPDVVKSGRMKLVSRPGGKLGIVAGLDIVGGITLYLLDENANLKGIRRLGQSGDRILDAIATNDGRIAATGYNSTFPSNLILLKTDQFWEEQAREVFANIEITAFVSAAKMLEMTDNSFVVAIKNYDSSNLQVSISKLSSSSRFLWEKQIPALWDEQISDLYEIPCRGILLTRKKVPYYVSKPVFNFRQDENVILLDYFDNVGQMTDSTTIARFPATTVSNPAFMPGLGYTDWSVQTQSGAAELSYLQIKFAQDSIVALLPEKQLQIQPNPSQGHAQMQFSSDFVGMVDGRIFSASGQLIHTFQSPKLEHIWQSDFCDQHLLAGIYTISVRAGADVFSGKWLKM